MKDLMELVYECNNKPVVIGDVVHVDNEPYTVWMITPPHKPSSTGRVTLRGFSDQRYIREFYPSVIKAEWVKIKVNGI
jgi:hypothetical protein